MPGRAPRPATVRQPSGRAVRSSPGRTLPERGYFVAGTTVAWTLISSTAVVGSFERTRIVRAAFPEYSRVCRVTRRGVLPPALITLLSVRAAVHPQVVEMFSITRSSFPKLRRLNSFSRGLLGRALPKSNVVGSTRILGPLGAASDFAPLSSAHADETSRTTTAAVKAFLTGTSRRHVPPAPSSWRR